MPLAIPLLQFGFGVLALGTGVKFLGDGLESTSDAATKLVIVAGVGAASYLLAKKAGVI